MTVRSFKVRVPIRSFDGDGSEDPRMWFGHALTGLHLSGIDTDKENPRDIAALLSLSLKGPAARWFETVDLGGIQNLGDFEGLFVRRFRIPNFKAKIMGSLQSMKMTKRESVAAYAERYRELVMLLGMSEDTHLQSFVNGLRSDIRPLVVFGDPKCFEQALKAAYLSESAADADGTHTIGMQQRVATTEIMEQRSSEASTGHKAAVEPQANISRDKGSHDEGTSCDRGQEPHGHTFKRNGDRGWKRGSIRCRYCGYLGHLQAECRKLKADLAAGKSEANPVEKSDVGPSEPAITQRVSALRGDEKPDGSVEEDDKEADSPASIVPCQVNKIAFTKVILDPGSSRTFVDEMAAQLADLRIRPMEIIIEGVNGVKDKAIGVTDPAEVCVGGCTTCLRLVVVNARSAFQVLIGMDYLEAVSASADFGKRIYRLPQTPSSMVYLRQIGREMHRCPVQVSDVRIWDECRCNHAMTKYEVEDQPLEEESKLQEESRSQIGWQRGRGNVQDKFPSKQEPQEVDKGAQDLVCLSSSKVHRGTESNWSSDPEPYMIRRSPAAEQPPDPGGSKPLQLLIVAELDERALKDLAAQRRIGASVELGGHGVHVFRLVDDAAVMSPDHNELLQDVISAITQVMRIRGASLICRTAHITEVLASDEHDVKGRTHEAVMLYDRPDINQELKSEQVQALHQIIRRHAGVFDISVLPESPFTYSIELIDGARPVRAKRLKRLSYREQQFVDAEIEKLESLGYIRKVDSPWSANVSVAQKKNGTLRLCVAYLGLNRVTEKMSFPLPRIDALLDQATGFGRKRYYCALDCASAFHSIRLSEESQPLTAFVTCNGTWCWRRMPFGLLNGSMVFQSCISRALQPLREQDMLGNVLVYIDDVCIFSDDFEHMLSILDRTLGLLGASGLRLSLRKSQFGYFAISFLGFRISGDGITPSRDKIKAILDWPPLGKHSTIKEVRSFLGTVNYYRSHIPRCAERSELLVELTRGSRRRQSEDGMTAGIVEEWTKAHDDCFRDLQAALTEAPLLRAPILGKPFALECDASNYAIGAVLSQFGDDGARHPVAYFSKTLCATERRYSVTDKEALSVVAALRHWRPYLHGSVTDVYTDHFAVIKVLTDSDNLQSGRRARWADYILEFDVHLHHRSGKLNTVADTLSRIPATSLMPGKLHSERKHETIQALFVCGLSDDQYMTRMKKFLQTGEFDPGLTWKEKRRIRLQSGRFRIEEDTLLYLDYDGIWKIVVPTHATGDLIDEYHSEHWGRDTTIKTIRRLYWWPTMSTDIQHHLRSCAQCQVHDPGGSTAKSPLRNLEAIQPFEVVEMDVVGPIYPVSSKGSKYVISATDVFTRWCETSPTSSSGTSDVLAFVTEKIFNRFGLPLCVLTDRGTCFGKRFTTTLERLHVKHIRASVQHPETLGLEERTHRIIVDRLKRLMSEGDAESWDKLLPRATFAVNSRVTAGRSISPLESLIGITPRRPVELSLLATLLTHKGQDIEPRIARTRTAGERDITERLLELGIRRDISLQEKLHANTCMERKSGQRRQKREIFVVGDLVKVKGQDRRGRFDKKWTGPAVVTWTADETYGITLNGLESVVHRDRLKRWY